eukprot:1310107-Alexandrium_andersonii.AAC.2
MQMDLRGSVALMRLLWHSSGLHCCCASHISAPMFAAGDGIDDVKHAAGWAGRVLQGADMDLQASYSGRRKLIKS